MHSSLKVLLAIAATAAAKTIVINAGQNGLTFSPDTTTADVGDTLEFHFFTSFHSVASGDFSTPCQMSSSGFDSGPINNKADGSGSVFQVTVKDTNPIWFFCGTPTHCESGMAGVVNPPSSGNSLASYKSAAAGASTKTGGTVQGGVVAPVPSGGGSSSSSPPSSSSSSATTPPSSTSVTSTTSPVSSQSSTGSSSSVASSSTSSSAAASTTSSTKGSGSPTATTNLTTSSQTSKTSSSATSSISPITTSGGSNIMGNFGVVGLLVASLGFVVGLM